MPAASEPLFSVLIWLAAETMYPMRQGFTRQELLWLGLVVLSWFVALTARGSLLIWTARVILAFGTVVLVWATILIRRDRGRDN